MELKVWVDNTQRIVCGVTEATTCQDVVYALAHATSQTGRFTLVEKWRSNERILSPSDKPLKVLLKWGEHSGDVQFVLRRSGNSNETQRNDNNKDALKSPYFSPQRLLNNSRENVKSPVSCNNREIKKSLTFSGGRSGASTPCDLLGSSTGCQETIATPVQNVRAEPPLYKDHRSRDDLPRGVVRGIPQQKQPNVPPETTNHKKEANDPAVITRTSKKIGPPPEYRIPPPHRQQSPINAREPPPPNRNFHSPDYLHNGNGVGTVSPIMYSHNISSPTSLVVSNASSPGKVLKKRDISAQHKDKSHEHISSPNNYIRGNNGNKYAPPPPERTKASQDKVYKRTRNDPQYLELLRMVNSQREKISSLDSELKKYDSGKNTVGNTFLNNLGSSKFFR